uniref:Protein kinase domain-containing protein n=1 Tax=Plectus sambesii TaxID=2011161 RepID=A0A914V9N6_9BILA
MTVMDLPTLCAADCELSSSFVVSDDGTGAYFSLLERNAFIFVDFETGELTDLTMDNFKTLNGHVTVHSTARFDEYECNSSDMTAFVGLLYGRERPSYKVYCTLFCANIREKNVSIIDEVDTNWDGTSAFYSYIYKSGSKWGKVSALKFMPVEGTLLVSQISLTESGNLEVKEVVRLEHSASFREQSLLLPFVENEAVYFFPNHRSDKLSVFSFNGTQLPCIPLTSSNGKFEKSSEFPKPVHFNGSIFYCTYEGNETTIWCLNMQQFRWSRQAKVHHHQRKWSQRNSLQILPDGTAFLHIKCNECENTSHLYQLDISVGVEHVDSQKCLGKGGFGVVYKGTLDQRDVAIKVLHEFATISMERKRQILLLTASEARKMKMLDHPNIVKGYGFKIDEKQFLLFMELMTESVAQKIHRINEKRLNESEAFQILQQALEGLVFLHTLKPKPIVHRDIKCANILLDDNGRAKLGDLGLVEAVCLNTAGTTDLDLAPKDKRGTVYWQAPEVIQSFPYGRKADVWSIGCVLVEMLTGFPPYFNFLKPTHWAVSLINGNLTYHPDTLIPLASPDVASILEKCFRRQTRKLEDFCVYEYHHDHRSSQNVRPHSWELICDVIDINELKPAQEKVELIESKKTKFRDMAQSEDD